MVKVTTYGIQYPSKAFKPFEPGTLVSGTLDGRSMIALSASDPDGRFLIGLAGGEGPFIIGDGQLSYAREIEGELIVEPAEGVPAFALPVDSTAQTSGCLMTNDDGEIGVRLVIPNQPYQSFVVTQNLATGQRMVGTPRFILSGYRVMLKVVGREKPLFLMEFRKGMSDLDKL